MDSTDVVMIATQAANNAVQNSNSLMAWLTFIVLALSMVAMYMGPIRAVKVGQSLHKSQVNEDLKHHHFLTLMMHRNNTVHADSVMVLNSIPVVWATAQEVVTSWDNYFQHLQRAVPEKDNDLKNHNNQSETLLVRLLSAMGKHLNYAIPEHMIINHYTPTLHNNEIVRRDKLLNAQLSYYQRAQTAFEEASQFYAFQYKVYSAMNEPQQNTDEKQSGDIS